MNDYFVEKNAEHYLDGLQIREHRREKCVELRGDYVEKFLKISEKMLCIFVRPKTFQTTLVLWMLCELFSNSLCCNLRACFRILCFCFLRGST